MKKYFIVIPIVFMAATALPAFAASISFSPSSVNSGSETSMIGTYDLTSLAQGSNAYFILYDHTGAEVSHSTSTGMSLTGSSQGWVSNFSFATSLATDTYTIYGVTGSANDGDGRLSACNTQANCNTAFGSALVHASTNVIITSGGGTPTSSTPLAPFLTTGPTASTSALVLAEVVHLPLFAFQNYSSDLLWLGIVIALIGAIFGGLTYFGYL